MKIDVKHTHGFVDLAVTIESTTAEETLYNEEDIKDNARMLLDAFTDLAYRHDEDMYYALLIESLEETELVRMLNILRGHE